MEGEVLPTVVSEMALSSLQQIYEYGVETFSIAAADIFMDELILKIEQLSDNYLFYPECRYIATKSKMYRNLLFGSYLVLYRITIDRVEVLNVLHMSRSITAIKAVRGIKIP